MSEPENFLARWSRRKTEGADETPAPAAETGAAKPGSDDVAPPASPSMEVSEPFDLTKLPSLESITEGTDISMFLQAGVPSSLRHAALRRAWTVDPAIRDFIGIAENQWDFTRPETVPGFSGLVDPADVERLLRGLVDQEEARAAAPQAEAGSAGKQVQVTTAPVVLPASEPVSNVTTSTSDNQTETHDPGSHGSLPQRTEKNIATPNSEPEVKAIAGRQPRLHGRALPS